MSQYGENNPNWKGGKRLHSKGYVELYFPEHHRAGPNGYVLEHLVVAEAVLGRPLEAHEIVIHRDQDRENNEPSNLKVIDRKDLPKYRRRPWIDVEKAIEMLKEGKHPDEVAAHFKVKQRAIYRALYRESKLEHWPPNPTGSKRHKKVDWDHVQKRLDEGFTVAAVARIVGISTAAIYINLKKGRIHRYKGDKDQGGADENTQAGEEG